MKATLLTVLAVLCALTTTFAQPVGQLRTDRAREDVGSTAGGRRHDEANRFGRVLCSPAIEPLCVRNIESARR